MKKLQTSRYPSILSNFHVEIYYKLTYYFSLIFQALAGDNVGVLLRGMKMKSVETGMLLCASKSFTLSNHYKAKIYFLTRSEGGRKKPIFSKYAQQMFSGTWNIACRLDLG